MQAEADEPSDRRRASKPGLQYAALPYRLGEAVEILLITSRETRRWVIPKGWPMKGQTPYAAAAQEAYEEAGLVGAIGKTAIGSYHYAKRLDNGAALACTVDVFPMLVTRQRKRWPEQGQRTGHWFNVAEAAAAVDEPELAELIDRFGHIVGRAALPLSAQPRPGVH